MPQRAPKNGLWFVIALFLILAGAAAWFDYQLPPDPPVIRN